MDERFGNVLKDHPDVLIQSNIYPTIKNDFVNDKTLPESFDGRDVWGTYLVSPANEILSNGWAIAAKDVLNDRFCLQSGGQLLTNFDEYEIISCMDIPPNRKVEGVMSYSDYKTIYQGYSIFDAWEYIYKFGVCQQNCFSKSQLEKLDITTPDKITNYNDKIKLYGNDCSNIEDIGRTTCLMKVNDKPIARRCFLSDAIYNVGGKNTPEDIKKIKGEIVRWGPVAAGFIVYENFIEGLTKKDAWRGTSIYKSVSGKPVGGHYVTIVGYGTEHKTDKDGKVIETTDYWICRNSWGTNWGLLGYFKIKIGIPECKLEENVSTCMPYLYERRPGEDNLEGILVKKEDKKDKKEDKKDKKEIKEKYETKDVKVKDNNTVNIFDMQKINPKLAKYRAHLKINFKLFYTDETVEFIKKGDLDGSLVPLIEYPKLLPDMRFFWVKDILDFDYLVMAEEAESHKNGHFLYYILFLITCMIVGSFGYYFKSKNLIK